MRTTILTTILAASLASAGASDSLALARFRADSAQAEGMLRQAAHADSMAWSTRVAARTMFELAVRNLQRDTAKAPAK